MIIYEYNGNDVWKESDHPSRLVHMKDTLRYLTNKHNCDISEINVRFTCF